jgi:hypothetical protein
VRPCRPNPFWAACLALQLLAGGRVAAELLRADLVPLGPRARTAAPIPVEVRLNWDSARLLEGRLEMEFREGNRVLGRYRTGEMALTTGDQAFRMLLPPPLAPVSDQQVEVRLKFVAARESFVIDPAVLFVPTTSERSLVVGWCGARVAAGAQPSGVERSLLLERYTPPAVDADRRSLVTSLARLAPEDLPAQPLAYTPFDIVVLTADAFREARERQLQALARWVKGGGSVCLFVTGALPSQLTTFLNTLTESASGGPGLFFDQKGNLAPGTKTISRFHSGLGRTVVVTGDLATDPGLESVSWREAVAFLWKVRAQPLRAIAETGHWDISTNVPTENTVYSSAPPAYSRGNPRYRSYGSDASFGGFVPFAVRPSELGAGLLSQLMPRTVRLIPLPALIGMLVLFLLAIGPLDYFVLGFFRRRRYTWILFPATSLGFMVATVLMANHYLGQRDQRHSLFVIDLDRQGDPLRWNRYELIFAARDKQAVTELKEALWAPLDFRWRPGQPYYRGYRYRPTEDGGEGGTPLYDGILPVHFRASETIRQWRPELNRTLSFEPPPVPLLRNWPAIEQAWPDLEAIRRRLSAGQPFTGDVCALSGPDAFTVGPGSPGIIAVPLLQELCVAPREGLLSLSSRVSPTGSGNFEDLVGHDPEGTNAVLAIVTRAGEDIVVYRRFFHGN